MVDVLGNRLVPDITYIITARRSGFPTSLPVFSLLKLIRKNAACHGNGKCNNGDNTVNPEKTEKEDICFINGKITRVNQHDVCTLSGENAQF